MKRLFDKVWLPNRGVLRLLIAIVISALLHFFWLTELSWELPKNTADWQVIDARLVPIKPMPIQQKRIQKELAAQPQPEPITPRLVEKASEVPIAESTMTTDAVVEDLPAVIADASINESVEMIADPSPIEPIGLPKPEPYQYIDTTFDIYLNEDEARSGVAKIVYDATDSLGRYKLNWSIEATGLLALFYPNLLQTSEGLVDAEQGLRPVSYRYQFGDKANKSYQAEFDWSKGELLLRSSKGDKTVALIENAQDYLSFMYQFMFKPPLNAMQISLTNGKRLTSYDYSFEGEETLTLDFGEVKTYHIKHAKSDSDEKTELWLAVDYQFIPVKISKTEKDGQVINQIAKVIYTKPVQLIQELPLP